MFAGGPDDKYTLVYKHTKARTQLVFLMFCLTTKKWIIKADQGNKKFITMMRSPIKDMGNYCSPLQANGCYWENDLFFPKQFMVLIENIPAPDIHF